MHRGKVDPGVSELPRGNELSRVHVNRPHDSCGGYHEYIGGILAMSTSGKIMIHVGKQIG